MDKIKDVMSEICTYKFIEIEGVRRLIVGLLNFTPFFLGGIVGLLETKLLSYMGIDLPRLFRVLTIGLAFLGATMAAHIATLVVSYILFATIKKFYRSK